MVGMEFFAWFESTALSVWVRESPLVFPSILIAHALGMGAVVGVNVAVGVQLLRGATRATSEFFAVLAPLMWLGFAASLLSGLLLLAAYPAKALTNLVFYLKILLIVFGFALFQALRRRSFEGASRAHPLIALGLLVIWFGTIVSGRLLAYTNTVLLASHFY
jgi:hypothetical protein